MKPTLKPLTNRAADGSFELPQDGWALCCPLGEWKHSATDTVQVIDEQAIHVMSTNFEPGEDLLVDYDHLSLSPDESTAAAGWVTSVDARADGLWVQIRWSKAGADAVGGGEFRYLSPVFLMSDCETLGNNRIRPLRLAEVALTNRPNIKLPSIANREPKEESSSSTAVVATTALDRGASLPTDPIEAFGVLVRNRQRDLGIKFEYAYDNCKAVFPEHYAKLVNRVAHFSPGTALANRILANDRPGEERMQPLNFPNVAHGRKFLGHVELAQQERGLTFERAFDKMKLEHPNDYETYLRVAEMLQGQS